MANFLAFGWPINFRSSFSPTPSTSNHSSTVRFPDALDSFIAAEISHGATAGPFYHNPFPTHLQTSPLQTVPKDDCKRRVVLDLSFPPPVPPLMMAFQKTLFWTNLFIFPFPVLPTSPTSSSARAQDASCLKSI